MKHAKPTVPEPVAVTTICSVCGLGWELHGPDPTTDDCVRVLKAELARRPYYSQPIIINSPPHRPWPAPTPYWYGTPYVSNQSLQTTLQTHTSNTPKQITSSVTPQS